MHNKTGLIVSSVIFLVPLTLPAPSAAGAGAYGALADQAGVQAPAAPEPVKASVTVRVDTRDADSIAALGPAEMSAATDAQRLEMLRTLIKESRPVQGGGETDFRQQELEKAILRLLGSAPDAASFDRMFYNVDQTRLMNSVSWSGDIKKLAARQLASAVPGDWAGLARYIDTVDATRGYGRNRVQFLIDGAGVIAPAMAAIEGAKKSIHIDVYQLQADEIGWHLARTLAAKAAEGVKVRVLVDQYGSAVDKEPEMQKLLAFLNSGGAEARVHKSPFLSGHRDHRKVMVIDGDAGFTGGMNVGRFYQAEWHDQQTLVLGPAVAALQDAFMEKWRASGGAADAREELYPRLSEDAGGVETRVVVHRGGQDQNIKAMYLRAFATAQRSIRVANPYFADPEVVKVLIAAARRGVKVQLVLPEDNDMKIVQRGSRSFYPGLLKAGVEIYEYQGRMAHEKVAVLDGYWATFGSSNLDSRSLVNNDELNLVVADPDLAAYVERQLFDADLQKSRRITSYSPDPLDNLAGLLHGWL